MLTNVEAGDFSRDRSELAAELFGSVRLQVEHVHVRWATAQDDIDKRLASCGASCCRFRLQKTRQSQATSRQTTGDNSANSKEVTP